MSELNLEEQEIIEKRKQEVAELELELMKMDEEIDSVIQKQLDAE